jgi:membrane protein DedA with SNARE-associated domain
VTFDGIGPYLSFFATHRHAVVFLSAAIDSTGLPFPGRVILVIAGAVATDVVDMTWMVLLAAMGALVGDHTLYLLGWLGGDRVLRLYCRWTLGSAHCIRKAEDYFRRFGGATIVIGRFVAGVRIFAAALAGSGGITYQRFLLFDVLGALLWAAACVLPGYLLGPRATRVLEEFGDVVLLAGLVLVLGGLAVIAFRVWKRRRHKPATMRVRAR